MSRISYINGRYMPHHLAKTHVEDRGYQFADGVYEVIAVNNHKVIDFVFHYDRLLGNLSSLKINNVFNYNILLFISKQLIKRNYINFGYIYIQITRGVSSRNHAFPKNVRPSLVITAKINKKEASSVVKNGVKVILTEDQRWGRCDIKSISLLANVLAKQHAVESDAYEAWLFDSDGFVTEGSSSNAWIIDEKNNLITSPLNNKILPGVTRKVLNILAKENNIRVYERKFSTHEAINAKEAFLTSTSNFVVPVVSINNNTIGSGLPGVITMKLIKLFNIHANSN